MSSPGGSAAGVPPHYAALGLQPTATPAEVTRQYRRLSLQYHPDRAAYRQQQQQQSTSCGGQGESAEAEAQRRFQEIAAAYAVLSDDAARHRYDTQHGVNYAGRLRELRRRVGRTDDTTITTATTTSDGGESNGNSSSGLSRGAHAAAKRPRELWDGNHDGSDSGGGGGGGGGRAAARLAGEEALRWSTANPAAAGGHPQEQEQQEQQERKPNDCPGGVNNAENFKNAMDHSEDGDDDDDDDYDPGTVAAPRSPPPHDRATTAAAAALAEGGSAALRFALRLRPGSEKTTDLMRGVQLRRRRRHHYTIRHGAEDANEEGQEAEVAAGAAAAAVEAEWGLVLCKDELLRADATLCCTGERGSDEGENSNDEEEERRGGGGSAAVGIPFPAVVTQVNWRAVRPLSDVAAAILEATRESVKSKSNALSSAGGDDGNGEKSSGGTRDGAHAGHNAHDDTTTSSTHEEDVEEDGEDRGKAPKEAESISGDLWMVLTYSAAEYELLGDPAALLPAHSPTEERTGQHPTTSGGSNDKGEAEGKHHEAHTDAMMSLVPPTLTAPELPALMPGHAVLACGGAPVTTAEDLRRRLREAAAAACEQRAREGRSAPIVLQVAVY